MGVLCNCLVEGRINKMVSMDGCADTAGDPEITPQLVVGVLLRRRLADVKQLCFFHD